MEHGMFGNTQYSKISEKRIVFLAMAFVLCAPSFARACAGTPITFVNITDQDYDVIDGTAGTGDVSMDADGDITYGAGYSGPGIGTAGVLYVSGTANCRVDISCATTATMSDGSGNTVGVQNIGIRKRRSNNTLHTCQGLGTRITRLRLRNNVNNNDIYWESGLDTASGVPGGGGTFSTSTSGGTSLMFEATYQNP